MRTCEDCGASIDGSHWKSTRCKQCYDKYRELYKKQFWIDNKDRYDRSKLGNPGQDEYILAFLKRKRNKIKNKK